MMSSLYRLILGHFGKSKLISCMLLKTNSSSLGWEVKKKKISRFKGRNSESCETSDQELWPEVVKQWDRLFHQPCFLLSRLYTHFIALIEPRSIIEVESWERSWTSGGLRHRQQHLQAADTDDWRSILSCCSYFTRCVPVNWRTRGKRETARLTTQPQLPLQLGSTYQSTDKQWPAESKQRMSLFTFSDIPFTPECCHTLQWLISPIQAHCLNITH